MTNSPYVRSALAQAAMGLAPPLIRETLISDSDFREEYGFKSDAVLVFSNPDVSIQRSGLFDAIRKSISGASDIEVTDSEGQKWELSCESEKGEPPTLAISHGKQHLILPDFAALSPDSIIRLRSLDKLATDANLPTIAQDVWRKVLSERALKDNEVAEFHDDLRDTPVHIARSIGRAVTKGQSSVSDLVPPCRKYFERLVGTYDGSASIRDYAAGSGRQFFEQLSAWRPYDGFLFSLLVASHFALTCEMDVGHLETEDLVRAFNFLEERGDRTSQLGAIEIGLRVLPEIPEIEPSLIRLIQQLRDDDVDKPTSGFNLLLTSFCLVDGELSRLRLFSAEPPFYRRLAALAQAALIGRQLLETGADTDHFCTEVFEVRAAQFYFQNYADMRVEPRWNPSLSGAEQIKTNFLDRVLIAAIHNKKHIVSSALASLLFENGPGSLNAIHEFPFQYLPSPLDGTEDRQNLLPTELSRAIQEQLNADEVGPTSFIALVNSAMIFQVSPSQAEMAAKALRIASHRLANVESRAQLMTILNGLATVSAVTRNGSLANELRILDRRYRRDIEYSLTINESLLLCLASAASRTELNDWREFVGEWLTELAFGDLDENESESLHFHLKCLLHTTPDLWVTCGRAEAALSAYNDH